MTTRKSFERCVIGIDPGNKTGIAVVTIAGRPRLVHSSVENLSKTSPYIWFDGLDERLTDLKVVCCAIEDQYLDKNIDSLKKLARTSGRWQEAALSHGIKVEFVAATTWQRAVLGRSAKKRDVLKRSSVAIAEAETGIKMKSDAADAFCLARYFAVELFRSGLFHVKLGTCQNSP